MIKYIPIGFKIIILTVSNSKLLEMEDKLVNLSNTDYLFIQTNLNRIPLAALAKKYKMTTLEFCKLLRTTAISTYIKDVELQFMKDCEEMGVPSKRVKETLGITSSTQFTQICSRHGFRQLRGLKDITLDGAIKNTRWLIEHGLKLDVDDFLPDVIRTEHFVKEGLSDCIGFAIKNKKNDSYFKNFSSVAFLVCKTYPENFRPFQFRHSKSNNYYKGKDGKKNFLQDLVWVIENKMDLKIKDIDTYISNNTFLRARDLSFYGLGYKTYKPLFQNVDEIRKELYKIYGDKKTGVREKTDKLRLKLLEEDIPFGCEVKNCGSHTPQVHHIIPKRYEKALQKGKIDLDAVDNLVFLCPNHHSIADQIDYKELLKINSELRREFVLDFLNEKDNNSIG